jgi:hypothetical protein
MLLLSTYTAIWCFMATEKSIHRSDRRSMRSDGNVDAMQVNVIHPVADPILD